MKISGWMLYALIALIGGQAAHAQAESLTMEQMVAELSQHPSVAAAKQRVAALGYEVEAANWQRYPSLSFQQGSIGGGGQQSSIQLSQPLYTFGAITNSIDAAQFRLEGSNSELKISQTAIIDTGIRTYLNALRQSERVEVNRRSVEEHERLAQAMTRRLDQQVGTSSDSQLANNRLNLAKADLFEAETQHERALQTLASLLEKPVTSVSVVEPLTLPFSEESEFQALAVNRSANLQGLLSNIQAQIKDIDASESRLKPQLVLVAEEVQNNVPTEFKDSRLIAYLQYQPGAGLSAKSAVNASKQRALAAESELKAAKKEVEQQVKQIWGELLIGAKLAEQLAVVQQSNRDIVDSFYKQFQAGKRSWVDVLNGQRELTQSELSVVDNRYRLLTAQYQALNMINAHAPEQMLQPTGTTPTTSPAEPKELLISHMQDDGRITYELRTPPIETGLDHEQR